MALMPPRRSMRLSNGHGSDELSSPPITSHKSKAPAFRPNAARIDPVNTFYEGSSAGSSSTSGAAPGRAANARRERRLEEIQSDDEGDDSADFMTGFTRPVISGNARHAAAIPVPRQPRTTFHEEAGDDGFIFSAADPSGMREQLSGIPGAKGPPPRASLAQHKAIAKASRGETGGAGLGSDWERQAEAGPSTGSSRVPLTPAFTDRRVSSGSVKAVRRVSLLRDGTAAYPHPTIADADLYRHCSSELEQSDRLRHLTLWTLDRSMKKTLSQFDGPSSSRAPLEAAIKATLQSLLRGEHAVAWPSHMDDARRPRAQSSATNASKQARPHPRNEANKRAENKLQHDVDQMEKEVASWERAKQDLREYEAETQALIERATEEEAELASLLAPERVGDNAEEAQSVQDARRALAQDAPWLQQMSTLSGSTENAVRLASDLFSSQYGIPVPARPVKRRRTTSARSEEHVEAEASMTRPADFLQGTEADPRWHDVEWKADQVRAYTHIYTQLALLASRYTTAISARGAHAIGELIGSANGEGATGFEADASKISRESQQTLQRILSGIRNVERGATDDDERAEIGNDGNGAEPAQAKPSTHPGDISDGDILRAFAGISSRNR